MLEISPFGATVLVDGRQLTGAFDREAEARLLAQLVPEDAPEAWSYGLGLGDLVGVLLERPALKTLHACVLSRQLFEQLRPLERFAGDPRLVVHMPGEVINIAGPWVHCPGELWFADAEAFAIRDVLMSVLNIPFNDFLREQTAKLRGGHEEQNAPHIATEPHVSALFDLDHRDAVVVMGGPTAASRFEWIRQRRFRVNLICAVRALAPLLAARIVPDVVVEIDPYVGNQDSIPEGDERLGDASLVALATVNPETIRRWPGRRFWTREGDLFTGGSVVHASCDLATKMGARLVHLVGCDFCFPGGDSHVEGAKGPAYDVESAALRTIDGNGQLVTTQESMAQYHRGLEVLIAERPQVAWIKHDRRGVPLRGACWFDEMDRAAHAA